MTDSIMPYKGVFKGKHNLHPISKLKKHVVVTKYNILCVGVMVVISSNSCLI